MDPIKRQANKAGLKLKTIGHAVEKRNRAVAREFKIMNQRFRSGESKKMTCAK